jgi:hypothetical protein
VGEEVEVVAESEGPVGYPGRFLEVPVSEPRRVRWADVVQAESLKALGGIGAGRMFAASVGHRKVERTKSEDTVE